MRKIPGLRKKSARNKLLLILFSVTAVFVLVIPIVFAVLWSLVDVSYSWSYPDIFPKVLSFNRWELIWTTTSLKQAMKNSYLLAFSTVIGSLTLAMPTAYALGRMEFKGKQAVQVLVLLPLVIPGFVIAIFFSSLLVSIGLFSKFWGILLGYCILVLPYPIRILSVSFSLVRQDLIDAARDLGASRFSVVRNIYWPTLRPGILAASIMVIISSIEEFALAFVIGSPAFITVPTILYSYLGYQFIRPNAAVVSLIMVIPNVILMLCMEKLLKARGMSIVGGKG